MRHPASQAARVAARAARRPPVPALLLPSDTTSPRADLAVTVHGAYRADDMVLRREAMEQMAAAFPMLKYLQVRRKKREPRRKRACARRLGRRIARRVARAVLLLRKGLRGRSGSAARRERAGLSHSAYAPRLRER